MSKSDLFEILKLCVSTCLIAFCVGLGCSIAIGVICFCLWLAGCLY